MYTQNTVCGHGCAVITILLWGTTFIATKILLNSFSPVEILFMRFLLGFAALWIIYPHRLRVTAKKHELYFAAAGFTGITLYYLLENYALTTAPASVVGIIISAAPFFTALWGNLFLKEDKPGVCFYAGLIISLTGIGLLSFKGHSLSSFSLSGILPAFCASMVWGLYSVTARKISTFGYPTTASTRRMFFYGLVFSIPVFFISKPDLCASLIFKPQNLVNILFLGLCASALCFVTWNSAVKTLGALKTSIYIYLVPVITAVTACIVLKEKMTGTLTAGFVLTLAGLFVSENPFDVKRRTYGEQRNEMRHDNRR